MTSSGVMLSLEEECLSWMNFGSRQSSYSIRSVDKVPDSVLDIVHRNIEELIMELNKENIINLLRNNDKAIGRALVVLYNNQTFDEKQNQDVKYLNNKGFRPCHARVGSSMAEQFIRRGSLTPAQARYWRVAGKEGMRIGIYTRQLIEAAIEKKKGAVK